MEKLNIPEMYTVIENEDSQVENIYLLDEAMHMDKIGLISTKLAEKDSTYHYRISLSRYSDIISSTCGQSISARGV